MIKKIILYTLLIIGVLTFSATFMYVDSSMYVREVLEIEDPTPQQIINHIFR